MSVCFAHAYIHAYWFCPLCWFGVLLKGTNDFQFSGELYFFGNLFRYLHYQGLPV